MNTKITIGVIVVLVIIGGLFFAFKGTAGAPTTTSGTATTTPQVQGQDVSVGKGAEAAPGSVVSVLYVGYLGTISTSTIFDSSAAHANAPLVFDLGTTTLIAGFQIGINGMKVGGERLLSIPPELGYGAEAKTDAAGKVVIPANSTLIFDVKLVDVKPGPAKAAQ